MPVPLHTNEVKHVLNRTNQTTVYLVRHAHSVYTPDEYRRGLSEKGWTDQEMLTDLMKNEQVDVVFSSPYMRAIQTVEGIARHINREVHVIEALKERTLASGPVNDFNEAIASVWNNECFHLPGGESNENARQRGAQALINILHTYKGKSIVIGTHGNILVLMMSYFDQSYDVNFWRSLDMPDVYRLTFDGKTLCEVKQIWRRTKRNEGA